MKEPADATGKTSRRRFAKTVASALVAVPVISTVSSCSQPPENKRGGNDNAASPTPQPSPEPDNMFARSGNPPVIIDGGSLGVLSPATLKEFDDDETTPKKYDHKFKEKNNVLGVIRAVRINNDYGDLLMEHRLSGSDTLKVHLWIQKVTREMGDDDDDTDQATYEGIADPNIPEVIVQGGALEIRMDKNLPKYKKLFKRAGRNPKRFQRHDWDGRPFRVAMVKVFVSSSPNPIYTSSLADADNGFRVILVFP